MYFLSPKGFLSEYFLELIAVFLFHAEFVPFRLFRDHTQELRLSPACKNGQIDF